MSQERLGYVKLEWTCPEIAEILDVPYGTVGSRLHHALRAMRAAIDASERVSARGGQPA